MLADTFFVKSTAKFSVIALEGEPATSATPAPAAASGGGRTLAPAGEANAALALCAELGIEQTTYAHAEAFTVEEQAAHVGDLEGVLTRNLFVKDKKHGMFLVTAWDGRDTKDTKKLGELLGLAGRTNLRLVADQETLMEKLGVKRGALSFMAVMHDAGKEVKFALDKALLKQARINAHPLRCDRTSSMTPESLLKFVKHCGHDPILLDYGSAPPRAAPAAPKPPKAAKAAKVAKAAEPEGGKGCVKGETGLKLQMKKSEAKDAAEFSQWYTQVITRSEMIDYYDISGCYILRPWSFAIWEKIQGWFDAEIKRLGVENAYFPLFVSERALTAEKDHVEGFAPEVAWVTRSGDSEMEQPIAIRPTSETIMYPAFANWIRSHRDLPLKLNQWCSVVRWEFKYPTPFLRSREFLWQEGHTAHATIAEADAMVMCILSLYEKVYEELLAVPVIRGHKTENEKFAGGHTTTTVEAYIPVTGRGIQGATSHNLGQNFGKMFKINYEDEQGAKQIPWQTSWGLTTRTIGVMVMVHGDDVGLVLPPRVAPIQVVIVPIVSKKCPLEALAPFVAEVAAALRGASAWGAPLRVKVDDRDSYTSGWKYSHWEQKGVPLRVEIGPRDLEKRSVVIVRRDDSAKSDASLAGLGAAAAALCEGMQGDMLARAKAQRRLTRVTEWSDFVPALNKLSLVLTPWCNDSAWEDKVKDMSRNEQLELAGEEGEDERSSTSVAAKTLCIPFDQPDLPAGTKCFASGLPAKCWVLWGRSY